MIVTVPHSMRSIRFATSLSMIIVQCTCHDGCYDSGTSLSMDVLFAQALKNRSSHTALSNGRKGLIPKMAICPDASEPNLSGLYPALPIKFFFLLELSGSEIWFFSHFDHFLSGLAPGCQA